jgi:hypothetical protein
MQTKEEDARFGVGLSGLAVPRRPWTIEEYEVVLCCVPLFVCVGWPRVFACKGFFAGSSMGSRIISFIY